MQFNHINTDRLILREITQEVMDFVFGNYSDSGLMNFFNYSEEQLAVEKEKYNKGYSTFNRTFLYFFLIDKESKKLIGWCGYHTWYVDHFRAEIGYQMIDKNFREKGLMREAIKAVIDYGFNEMKLNRVEAMVAEYNTTSLKLLERLNFKQEGCLKKHYLVNDKYEDSLVFGLLKEDYQ